MFIPEELIKNILGYCLLQDFFSLSLVNKCFSENLQNTEEAKEFHRLMKNTTILTSCTKVETEELSERLVSYYGGNFIYIKNKTKKVCLALVRKEPKLVGSIPKEFEEDEEIAREAIKVDWSAFYYLSYSLRSNKKFILSLDDLDLGNLSLTGMIPEHLIADRDIVKFFLRYNGLNIPDRFEKDKEIVLLAVKKTPETISRVDRSFRDDKEVVMEAVRGNGNLIIWASNRLKKDREVVLCASKNCSIGLIPWEFRDDKEIVLLSIEHSSCDVMDISNRLQKDRDIVIKIIENNPLKLEYLSESFRDDEEIVKLAISISGEALEYASDRFKNDKDFIYLATLNGYSLEDVPESLRNDKNILLNCVQNDESYFKLLPLEYKKDRDVVLEFVKRNGNVLKYSTVFNKEIVLSAVEYNGMNLKYAPLIYRKDRDIVIAAVKDSPHAIEFTHRTLRDDEEIVRIAISVDIDLLKFASWRILDDKKFALSIIKKSQNVLYYLSDELQDDEEIIMEAMGAHGDKVLKHASDRLEEKFS